LLPYFGLFLPEIFLFSVGAVGWYLLYAARPSCGWISAIGALASLAAFLHLRGLAIAMFLAVGAVLRVGVRSRYFVALISVGLVGGAFLLLSNMLVHQHPLGSVNTARPSYTWRSTAALFLHFRHGVLIFSPFWLLAILAATRAAIRGRRCGIEALV
jgi:hypothetical protein